MAPINFELLDLRALIAVSDMRSFHRAAEHLALSQPALSRRIQKLEQAVGAPLLERSSRSVRLTSAGQQVLPLLRRMVEEVDGWCCQANANRSPHDAQRPSKVAA